MKLYFYTLDTEILTEEVEAQECPKTYKLDHYPEIARFCGKIVSKKDDIGRITGHFFDTVILPEPDLQRVAELFTGRCRADIQKATDRIHEAEESIRNSKEAMNMIEEWRKEEFERCGKPESEG